MPADDVADPLRIPELAEPALALRLLEARCLDADPEAFFPEKGGSTREAKRICAACPVRDDCLQYALENDERFGIWGGLSERERRRAKRVRPARVRRLSA